LSVYLRDRLRWNFRFFRPIIRGIDALFWLTGHLSKSSSIMTRTKLLPTLWYRVYRKSLDVAIIDWCRIPLMCLKTPKVQCFYQILAIKKSLFGHRCVCMNITVYMDNLLLLRTCLEKQRIFCVEMPIHHTRALRLHRGKNDRVECPNALHNMLHKKPSELEF